MKMIMALLQEDKKRFSDVNNKGTVTGKQI